METLTNGERLFVIKSKKNFNETYDITSVHIFIKMPKSFRATEEELNLINVTSEKFRNSDKGNKKEYKKLFEEGYTYLGDSVGITTKDGKNPFLNTKSKVKHLSFCRYVTEIEKLNEETILVTTNAKDKDIIHHILVRDGILEEIGSEIIETNKTDKKININFDSIESFKKINGILVALATKVIAGKYTVSFYVDINYIIVSPIISKENPNIIFTTVEEATSHFEKLEQNNELEFEKRKEKTLNFINIKKRR